MKKIIDSHPPWFYLFSGEVDRKQIDEDVKKLTAYYRAFGFFDARVGRDLEFNENQDWLTITFVIDEGRATGSATSRSWATEDSTTAAWPRS